MEHLWAPWRIEYIQNIRKTEQKGCLLCRKPQEENDEASLILYRGKANFVMLNAFPYNPGHLMVAPYRHLADLQSLTDEEAKEHFALIKKGTALLTKVLNPAGFNIGLNLGRVGGAGIEGHLHTHVVPRWEGDTNFMPVLGDTRVVSQALADTYRKLKSALG